MWPPAATVTTCPSSPFGRPGCCLLVLVILGFTTRICFFGHLRLPFVVLAFLLRARGLPGGGTRLHVLVYVRGPLPVVGDRQQPLQCTVH